jgi:hypothetical protein
MCNDKIYHSSKYNRDRLEKKRTGCKKCGIKKMKSSKSGQSIKHLSEWYARPKKDTGPFIRNCPLCDAPHDYISKWSMQRAAKSNAICNSCSSIVYKKSWTYVIKDEHIKQMSARKAGYESFDAYMADLDNKKKYRREVSRITRQQDITQLENYDKIRGLCGVNGAYQLDHIISISEGYDQNISPSEIGNISNLRIIPWKDNLLKSNK